MKLGFTSLLVLLIISITSVPVTSNTIPVVDYPNNLSRTTLTNISVIIDSTISDPSSLIGELDRLDGKSYENRDSDQFVGINELDIRYNYLSDSDHDLFVNYLLEIEESSGITGHKFNLTTYAMDDNYVFDNVTGRSYDAEMTLDYLADNIWDGYENRHTLFLFNLTELDRGMEHWFRINPPDLDTGRPQSSFFSQTQGLYHGKSVSAWGGHSDLPVHFIDFSSELWFGDFINAVWSDYNYYDTLLSNKIQDFTTSDSQQEWMGQYLRSFLTNTYNLEVSRNAPIGDSVKIQTIILYDWYEYGIDIEQGKDLITTTKINETLSSAFNWLDFNVTDVWYNLSDFDALVNEMKKYRTQEENGEYLISLDNGLLSYIQSNIIPQLFDLDGADIILPSLVFFLNHSRFTYRGIPVAGIGGNGYQLQGLSVPRYVDQSGNQIRGFSDVIVHEVGHSLGIPHPFNPSDSWVGDMTASIMGYYSSYPDFSRYDINTLGYYYSNHYLVQAEYIQSQYDGEDELKPYLEQWIESSVVAQNQWEFRNSIDNAILALCGYAQIYGINADECSTIDLDRATDLLVSSSNSSGLVAFQLGLFEIGLALIILLVRVARRK